MTTEYRGRLPYTTSGGGDGASAAALTAHSADALVHSSGLEIAYAENVTNTPLVLPAAAYTDIPGCSITIPPTVRPVWIEGRFYFDITASPAAGTTTNLQAVLTDELDANLDAGSLPLESNAVATGFAEVRVMMRLGIVTAQKTIRLRGYRSNTAGFTGQILNGSTAAKSWITAFSR